MYQYALHTNNCRCKRAFSLGFGSLSELRPLLWLSSITLRHAIRGRIPLARPRDPYLTKHNTHETHIYAPAGFEHTNPASQRSRTLTLDRAALGVEPSY